MSASSGSSSAAQAASSSAGAPGSPGRSAAPGGASRAAAHRRRSAGAATLKLSCGSGCADPAARALLVTRPSSCPLRPITAPPLAPACTAADVSSIEGDAAESAAPTQRDTTPSAAAGGSAAAGANCAWPMTAHGAPCATSLASSRAEDGSSWVSPSRGRGASRARSARSRAPRQTHADVAWRHTPSAPRSAACATAPPGSAGSASHDATSSTASLPPLCRCDVAAAPLDAAAGCSRCAAVR